MSKKYELKDRNIRVKEVATILGIGCSTVWERVKKQDGFPKPWKLSPRVTVWSWAEIVKYNEECKEAFL